MFEEEVDGRDGGVCAASDVEAVEASAEDTAGSPTEEAGTVADADAPTSCGFDAAF